MIEVAITPNRPDCLGVRGIARDLAAAGLGKLTKDAIKPVKGSFANPIPIKLEFDKESADACPVFAGRLVRGVKNGPSPDWLQRRLKAIGLQADQRAGRYHQLHRLRPRPAAPCL